jgi:HSP20 family molecular chaperone IbpA
MSAKAAVDESTLPVAAVTRNGAWLPAVDVRELPDEYIVLADLPGLKPGDVDVTWDDNILTIAGARRDRLHTGGVPFRLERPTGRLLRSLRLPDGCDAAELEAHIRDGVLEVRIPRAARTIRNATPDGFELAAPVKTKATGDLDAGSSRRPCGSARLARAGSSSGRAPATYAGK